MQPAASSRRGSFDLFRVGKIQVSVDPSWLIIFFLIVAALAINLPEVIEGLSPFAYLVGGLVGALLFFGSVLVHELSHSIVANRSGAEVRRITLFLFGGVSQLSEEPKGWKDEIKIAAVGPLSSFVLAAVFFGLQQAVLTWVGAQNLTVVLLGYLAAVNLVLAVFNLLPGLPLDGGRIARGLFWRRSGDMLQATRRAARWGVGVSVAVMVWGGLRIVYGDLWGIWLILIGLFLRGAAQSSVRTMVLQRSIEGVLVRDVMIEKPVTLSHQTTLRQALDHFLQQPQGSFPVLFGREPLGILSLGQLREGLAEGKDDQPISSVMERLEPRRLVSPDLPVEKLLRDRWAEGAHELIVMDEDEMVGWVTPSVVQRFVEVRSELGDLATRAVARSASDEEAPAETPSSAATPARED